MIRINLLPPEYDQAQAKREQQVFIGGASAVLVVILAALWMFQARRAAALDAKIVDAQASLAKYQAIVSQIEKIEQDQKRLGEKRDVIRNLNRSRLVYPVFFEDLLPIIPADVWVTSIQLVEQAGGGMQVTLTSNALSNFALATWLTNLQQSKHFSGVDLSAISYTPVPDTAVQNLSFVIKCQYQHSGPFPLQEYN